MDEVHISDPGSSLSTRLPIKKKKFYDTAFKPLVPELFGRARKNLIFHRGIEHYRFIFLSQYSYK